MLDPKIRIFYIHYNAARYESASRDPGKIRPKNFSYENCFDNLVETIRCSKHRTRVELSIWFDGNNDDFVDDFISKKIPSDVKTNLLLGEFRGGTKSCIALVHHLANAKFDPDDLIYVLENDYSHQHDWVDKTFDLVASGIHFDYLSLYDHLDNYRLPIHLRMNTKLFTSGSQIWKTGLSTCWSFIMRHRTLLADYSLLASNEDFILFVKLNLIGRTLLIAVPGLSTHGMAGSESPGVDWALLRGEVNDSTLL